MIFAVIIYLFVFEIKRERFITLPNIRRGRDKIKQANN